MDSRESVVVRLSFVVLCCLLGIAMLSAPAVADGPEGMDGNGTASDPYEITNATQLQAMEEDLDAHYVLVGDVDASGTAAWNDGPGFDPIGDSTDPFTGTIEGNHAEVTSLTIDRSGSESANAAVFGATDGAAIRNVSLVGATVIAGDGRDQAAWSAEAGTPGGTATGFVVEMTGGSIEGVHVVDSTISGGNGGDGGSSNSGDGGHGGDGGDAAGIADSVANGTVLRSSVTADTTIVGGSGGDGGARYVGHSAGDGGDGGSTGGIAVEIQPNGSVTESYVHGSTLAGGDAGPTADGSGSGGDGGSSGGIASAHAGAITESYVADTNVREGGGNGAGANGVSGAVIARPDGGELTTVYWDTDTVDQDSASGDVTGLTTNEMTGIDAAEFMDGLDYGTTWLAVDDEDTYPVLGWQVDSYRLSLADEIDVGYSTDATVDVALVDGTSTTATTTSNYTTSGNVSVDDGTVTGEDYGPDTVTATGGGLSDAVAITALDSDVRVELVDSPDSVGAGETYEFEVTVENVGNTEGTVPVEIAFDGETVIDESVTVSNGATDVVSAEYEIPAAAETGTAELDVTTPDDASTVDVQVYGLETLSGTLTDGVAGEPLSNVDVEVDGSVENTTDANGEYEVEVPNSSTVAITATTADATDPVITASEMVTVDGATEQNLELWPELAGSGTETDPYELGNAYELQAMHQDLDANYTLVDDVDASGTADWNDGDGFDPVGEYGDPFTGSFDGGDDEIRRVTIDRSATDDVGVFGFSAGTIANATLADVTVSGDTAVGGLVGYNDGGTIANATVGGNVTASDGSWGAGGIAGGNYAGGTVRDSRSSVVVDGSDGVGGLVGENAATISTSRATGSVDGSDSVGGLAGGNPVGLVEGSVATGDVTGANYVGGLVGDGWEGTVTGSAAIGTVNGTGTVGGLLGGSGADEVTGSYASGSVTGGTVGGVSGGSIDHVTNVYWNVSTATNATASGDSTGARGLTPDQMTGSNATADGNMDGLDDSAWTTTDGYPRLAWEIVDVDLGIGSTDLEPDETTPAAVTLTLVDGSTLTATDVAVYETSDAGVVTVANGTVTAVDDGNAIVTVTAGGLTAMTDVSVTTPVTGSDRGHGGDLPIVDGERTITVVDLSVDDATPRVGETVTAIVTVENDDDATGTFEGEILLDGESIAERSITVEGGETASVSVMHTFERAGTYTVVAGDERVTVTVVDDGGAGDADDGPPDETSTDDEPGGSGVVDRDGERGDGDDGGDSMPGFGALAALFALVGTALLARRRP